MKKLTLSIFILFIGILILQSQNISPETLYLEGLQFNSNVKLYYKNINKAELQIIRGNYKKASHYYKKAFKYKEPFPIDLHRAIVSECLTSKDSATIVNYLILKLKTRHTITNVEEKIEEYKNIYPELATLQYWKSLSKILDTVKIDCLRNESLIVALDSLGENDQKVRNEGIAKYSHQNIYKPPYSDTIRVVDSINMSKLIALWELNGEISPRNAPPNAESVLRLLIQHSTMWHDLRWLKYLKAEVNNGTIDNKIFSHLVDRSFGVEYEKEMKINKATFLGNTMGFALYDKYLIFKISKKENKKINKRRKKLYLCTLQEEHEKRLWQFRQKYPNLNSRILFSIDSYIYIDEGNIITDEMKNEYLKEQDNIINSYNKDSIILYNK